MEKQAAKLNALLRFLHDAFWNSRKGNTVVTDEGIRQTLFGLGTEYRPYMELKFELINQFPGENIDADFLISRLVKRRLVDSIGTGILKIQYAINNDGKEFLLNGGFEKEEQQKSDTSDLLKYQKEIAEWQVAKGNKITSRSEWMLGISIGVAVLNIIVSALVAYYISQNAKPQKLRPTKNVIVDSLSLEHAVYYHPNDTTKHN